MRKRIELLLLIAIIIFILAGCGTNSNRTHADLAKDVSIEDALRMWQNKEVVMLDVRTPAEYAQGHIPGILLIPLDQLLDRIAEVPKDKKVLVICRSGNRSSQATAALRERGYTNVFNVTSGMMQWKGPVETGASSQ